MHLPYRLRPKFSLRNALVNRKRLFLALSWYRFQGHEGRIFANSIPKSGTHLLSRCLELMPRIAYSGYHINDVYNFQRQNIRDKENMLRMLGSRCFVSAHIPFSEEGLRLLEKLNYKHLVMIRDPRDVVVSQLFDIMKRESHWMHDYFIALPDKDSRLIAVICGVPDSEILGGIGLPGVRERFEGFVAWSRNGSHVIRFEHLIGPDGGGDETKQLKEVQDLAAFLGLSLSATEVATISRQLYYRKANTFRKGEVGDWRNHLGAVHKEMLKEEMGQMLLELGYETNTNW